VTQTAAARTEVRYRGAIYGLDVLDHMTRRIVPDDYVGKTRQRGRSRETQHRDRQPFSDLIVGDAHVLWEGICTEDELDEMERHFIQDVEVRPRLNEKMNEDNPRMIPKGVQRAQRWERDDAAGKARWVPFDRRQRSSLLEWDATRPEGLSARPYAPTPSRWKPWQIKVGLLSSAWLLLAVATWGAMTRFGLSGTWRQNLLVETLTSSTLLVWSLWRQPDTWPMWRRRLRKLGPRPRRRRRR
jgi:hypothetical protein